LSHDEGGQHLARFRTSLGYGIVAMLFVSLPFVAGALTYFVFKYAQSAHPQLFAECIAWVVFLAIPTYILGNALRISHARKNNDTVVKAPKEPGWEDTPAAQKPTSDAIDAWKTAVEVQQHFNQLELQIRNFAVSLLAAVIGGSAFAIKEDYQITIGTATISAAVPILAAGIFGLLAFYFMDRWWYHNLLLGAVFQALKIEKHYGNTFPELALSTMIGKESPQTFWKFEIHSQEKIDIFYSVGLALLIFLAGGMMLVRHGISADINPISPVSTFTKQKMPDVPQPSSANNQTNIYLCPPKNEAVKNRPKRVAEKANVCPAVVSPEK
jgi:hypothetical protein